MLALVTYDVSVSDKAGRTRLRKVSKVCQNYGQRVQNSVFECIVDNTQLTELKIKLLEIIDTNVDSLRVYNIGNNHKNKVEHFGTKKALDLEDVLLF
ncbi:CRISPR-associated endonuclease Cas2 [Jeotgalibaca sp. A127]|uniref:CRISPR-associated endonuclease Cas2 n=1 Tax=Jeotgalibaca sp. A127 TaxID=3457324 RepID=UPI003FD14BD3